MEAIKDQMDTTDLKSAQEGKAKMQALFKKHGVSPLAPMKGLLIQGPIFMSFFFAISNMVEKVPSLKGGGALWFTDLTTPDSLYLFPVLTGLTAFATVEFNLQQGMEGNPMSSKMKNVSRGMAFLTVPFTMNFAKDHCSSRSCEEDFDGATTTCGKWHPGESQRPEIDDAPIFTPTEEEFKDAIGCIASIRPQAEKYGICRIIPPSSWRPLCPLKEKSFWESTEFNTRVQQVDKLQNRQPTRKRAQPRVQRKRKRRKRLRFGMTQRRLPLSPRHSHLASAENSKHLCWWQFQWWRQS